MTVVTTMDTVTLGEPSESLIDVCISFGPPETVHDVAAPTIVTRTAGPISLVTHSAGAIDMVERGVAAPNIRDRDVADPDIVERSVGVPVTQDRSTTIEIVHGTPGPIVIECEEP
jgi:hypothetical protein